MSPDRPDTVTIITNYLPLEGPAGGPNFYEFGDDVRYTIYVDNDADGRPDIAYHLRFTTEVTNKHTFLYNTGPIGSLSDPNWNRRQFYTVSRRDHDHPRDDGEVLGSHLASPPCNIGVRSTPGYAALASAAIHTLPTGELVFAGQRREGFFVDLGSVFDLGALRPFQSLHLIPLPNAPGVDTLAEVNVHTIALQIPIKRLTRDGSVPDDPMSAVSVLGVWGAASRHRATVHEERGEREGVGPWVQVSRLGNPLFNEVIVPMARKDEWNALDPEDDSAFLQYVQHPELAGLLPVLYPGVFPHLAALSAVRADLVAILLTGIPKGIIPGFQNFTGTTYADMLRLNVAIPPTTTSPSRFGILGGDLAGFPNGRRVFDDTVAVELRAVAGATYPLVQPAYVPDAAASVLVDGTGPAPGTYQDTFPYLGTPLDGFHHPA